MNSIHQRTGIPYKISVNISIIQLLQDDFVEIVLDSLEESGLVASSLELEITESIFMESFGSTVSKLEFLQSRGIRIALDDFGTGYSSLSYLQQLPISTLKMDKVFIDSLADKAFSESFVQTIITLGHKMGLDVVAEGVEDASQWAFLRESHCDKVQGYLINAAGAAAPGHGAACSAETVWGGGAGIDIRTGSDDKRVPGIGCYARWTRFFEI